MQVDCSQVLAYLDGCRDEMLRLWETIVRLEVAKYNPSLKLAVDISRAVGAPIEEIFVFES